MICCVFLLVMAYVHGMEKDTEKKNTKNAILNALTPNVGVNRHAILEFIGQDLLFGLTCFLERKVGNRITCAEIAGIIEVLRTTSASAFKQVTLEQEYVIGFIAKVQQYRQSFVGTDSIFMHFNEYCADHKALPEKIDKISQMTGKSKDEVWDKVTSAVRVNRKEFIDILCGKKHDNKIYLYKVHMFDICNSIQNSIDHSQAIYAQEILGPLNL